MKLRSILFILFSTMSFFLMSQEENRIKYASITDTISEIDLKNHKAALISFLESQPGWNKQENLKENISFQIKDIQIYGYLEFPILQIDFRYTFESKRKKGYLYQAQYIFISQPRLNKTSVVIDPGTTKYLQIN